MPMPTLAVSERPDDDAVIEGAIVPSELVVVLVELRDANAVDVGLEMDIEESTVVLELRDSDAIAVEGLESTINACPRTRRLLESLQQSSPSNEQHQAPEEIGGHANSLPPSLEWPRFTKSHQSTGRSISRSELP